MSKTGIPAQGIIEYPAANGTAILPGGVLPAWNAAGAVGDLRDGAEEDVEMNVEVTAGRFEIKRPATYVIEAKVPVEHTVLGTNIYANLVQDPANTAAVLDHDSCVTSIDGAEDDHLLLLRKVVNISAADIAAGLNIFQVVVLGAAGVIGNLQDIAAAKLTIEKRRQ